MVNRFRRSTSRPEPESAKSSHAEDPNGSYTGQAFSQRNSQTLRQTKVQAIEDGPGERSATALRLAITRTARKMRQEAGSDLSPTALATMASIERHPGVTPTRLAEIEGVKRPTATRVIAYLTDTGMISREADPDDGRSCRLELTDQGSVYLQQQRSRKSAYLAQLLDTLPPDEVETLQKAAAILQKALEGSITSEAELPARSEVHQ